MLGCDEPLSKVVMLLIECEEVWGACVLCLKTVCTAVSVLGSIMDYTVMWLSACG